VLLFVYFLAPLRTNMLVLGVDDSLGRGDLGRTDTIILTTVVPLLPYVGLLGIPRDLWVEIPNVGEQRINTAYFFAEANQAGTGASATVEAVRQNFGVPLRYYLVLHMSGLIDFVDALGGVDITLETPLGGLPAGQHHLDGAQALAFVRERYSADDFSRMQQGQILIMASFRKAIQPGNWTRLPGAFWALTQVVDANIPVWQWPRLGFAFLRAVLFGVDSRTITREMVTPFQTSGGAQVLAPNWEAINPLLVDMFGE
jgi:LCP family protein required for cell wall assembly